MREVLDELNQWTREGEDIALATVVETWGSSPRPLGSKMLVTRSGKMAGSVSNGCIEGAVFEEAQKVLKSGTPKVAAFGVADDVAFEVGRPAADISRFSSSPSAALTGSSSESSTATSPRRSARTCRRVKQSWLPGRLPGPSSRVEMETCSSNRSGDRRSW